LLELFRAGHFDLFPASRLGDVDQRTRGEGADRIVRMHTRAAIDKFDAIRAVSRSERIAILVIVRFQMLGDGAVGTALLAADTADLVQGSLADGAATLGQCG